MPKYNTGATQTPAEFALANKQAPYMDFLDLLVRNYPDEYSAQAVDARKYYEEEPYMEPGGPDFYSTVMTNESPPSEFASTVVPTDLFAPVEEAPPVSGELPYYGDDGIDDSTILEGYSPEPIQTLRPSPKGRRRRPR